ncbi:CHASE3 domain-containing protein [Roseateles asaccharophilus]|uniref:histidine kinase n=1 Tax=Roseateles asaccharophilus TaxID=582607 RepID=A0ABU2ACF0_9BURK|nr:CHASE3 domain-containing protein [Roseateles asaccharophilus]MDR7334876.1 signal transduction histidine kinase [Roseateles asaccharophilus]
MSLLIAAFLAFVGTAGGAKYSLDDLAARDAERSDALRLQTELQRLMTLLVDVETGQRGFIITGQQPFLRPYEDALAELGTLRGSLMPRLKDSGIHPDMLKQLNLLINMRLGQAKQVIERRMTGGDAVARDLSAYVDGKRVMDDLRFQVEQLAQEQQRRVATVDRLTQDVQERTTWLTHLLMGVGLVTLGLAVAMLYREHRLRDQAEIALRDANAGLESQVAQRTEALSRALLRIRSFASELDRSIETERRRLAREVHDQIGQVGTAIKMLSLSLRAKLAPRTEPLLDELQELADESIRSARQISAALRPPLLDELGLEAALGHYLQALGRQTGLKTELALDDADMLSRDQANPLFRIVQEACTNVLRHAQANTLRVAGRPYAEDQRDGYELEVLDNGRGPGGTRADASGLRGMRERAALAGGVFDFGPALGGGTRVRVWVPLEAPGSSDRQAEEEGVWQ